LEGKCIFWIPFSRHQELLSSQVRLQISLEEAKGATFGEGNQEHCRGMNKQHILLKIFEFVVSQVSISISGELP
jgi:hypothetical protein